MRQTWVIALLCGLVVILVAAIAFLLGRMSGTAIETTNASTQVAPSPPSQIGTPPTNKAVAQPQTKEEPSDARLARDILGYWANGNCDTDNGEHFAAGGEYGAYEARGRWRIERGRLLVTVTHAQQDPNAGLGEGEITPVQNPPTTASQIRSLGATRMDLVTNGERYTLIRCSNPTV